jgi:hypothetical protein
VLSGEATTTNFIAFVLTLPGLETTLLHDTRVRPTLLTVAFQKQWQLELWVTSLGDTPRLQYYDVQTIFLHAHLQAVCYNCVKFHLNPMSRLGVAFTSPSLHTECISEYKLNYLPFLILDSDHISSGTSAGSVLQLCKVSQNSNKPFRRSCAYKVNDPPFC